MIPKIMLIILGMVIILFGDQLYLKDIDALYLQYADSNYSIREKVLGAKAIALETKSNEPNQKPLQNVYELEHLLKILVKNSEDSILTFIRKKTNRSHTKDLCISTVRYQGTRSFRITVFSQWALEDSTNIELLPYHPNGLELLMEIVENESIDVKKRISAINSLIICDIKPYYERLSNLELDSTIVVKRKGSRSQLIFGDIVKDFLHVNTRSWKK